MEYGAFSFPRTLSVKETFQVFFTRTPPATSFSGTINIGDGPFDGISTGTFVGSASGTVLAINSLSSFTGNLFTISNAGAARFSVASTGIVRMAAQGTGAQFATLSLGAGSFSATALGGFAGNSNGTMLGCDASNSFTGDLINLQLASASNTPNNSSDVRLKLDYQGQLTLAQPPQGVATTGLVMLGSGSFAGGGAPAFNGSSSGTVLAINAATGYAGNLAHFQIAGVDKWKVDSSGNLSFAGVMVPGILDAPAFNATLSLTVTAGEVHKVGSITGAMTINASSGGVAGQRMTIILPNDSSGTGRVVTFGTNFKSAGTLTGVSAKSSSASFISDGTSWYEESRVVGTMTL